MGRKILITISIIIVLILFLFIGTGFTKNPNVVIREYSVSEDGKELNFSIGIPFSIGYTRGFQNKGGGVKTHYLNFYNTFGVINSSLGAKFDYVLELMKMIMKYILTEPTVVMNWYYKKMKKQENGKDQIIRLI